MRGEACGARVRFPDVHLVAAGAAVGDVGFAVDPGGRVALSVAVAGAVGGAGGIQGAAAAGGQHVGEVEGAVHAADEGGDVDFEGEFLVQERGRMVGLAVLSEEVDSRRDGAGLVGGGIAEVLAEGHARATGLHAEAAVVSDTFDDAVLAAGLFIGADGAIEAGGIGAGGVGSDFVDGVCGGVEHKRGLLLHAAAMTSTVVGC